MLAIIFLAKKEMEQTPRTPADRLTFNANLVCKRHRPEPAQSARERFGSNHDKLAEALRSIAAAQKRAAPAGATDQSREDRSAAKPKVKRLIN
jgi:hypothetical protein